MTGEQAAVGGVGKGRGAVAAAVADEWRKAGMSEAGIAGVMANIQDESAFKTGMLEKNPTGHAKALGGGHGLYQFTGPGEWSGPKGYLSWLKQNYPGKPWTDPRLQSRFVIHQLKSGHSGAGVWERMKGASAPGAAKEFVRSYLRPRADLRLRREARYGRGIPGVEHYTGGAVAPTGEGGPTGGAGGGIGAPGRGGGGDYGPVGPAPFSGAGGPLPANQAARLGFKPIRSVSGTVPVSAPSGTTFRVAPRAAPQFRGFLRDLEATGYKTNLRGGGGGWVYRTKAGGGRSLSQHAYGTAIDIDPAHNPFRTTRTNLPRQTSELAKKWGLSWGMEWHNTKDPMHFEISKLQK